MQHQQQHLHPVLIVLPALWVVLPAAQSWLAKAVSLFVRLRGRWRKTKPGTQSLAPQDDATAVTSTPGTLPLQQVVTQCEAKWLLENLQDALRNGCPKAVRKVQEMMEAGFGAKQGPHALSDWAQQAWLLHSMRAVPGHGSNQHASHSNQHVAVTRFSSWPAQACNIGDAASKVQATSTCQGQQGLLAATPSFGPYNTCVIGSSTPVPGAQSQQSEVDNRQQGDSQTCLEAVADSQPCITMCQEPVASYQSASTAVQARCSSQGDGSAASDSTPAASGLADGICFSAACMGVTSLLGDGNFNWLHEHDSWSDDVEPPPDDPDDSDVENHQ